MRLWQIIEHRSKLMRNLVLCYMFAEKVCWYFSAISIFDNVSTNVDYCDHSKTNISFEQTCRGYFRNAFSITTPHTKIWDHDESKILMNEQFQIHNRTNHTWLRLLNFNWTLSEKFHRDITWRKLSILLTCFI